MLNKKELLILSKLRADSRKSLAKISQETKIPVSTIFDKVNKLKKVIKKHTCILDFSKIGYSARVNLALKTSKDKRDALKQFLLKNKNVNSLYRTHEKYDFIAECLFKDLKEFYDFLEQLDKFELESKEEFHIVEEIKSEDFLNS